MRKIAIILSGLLCCLFYETGGRGIPASVAEHAAVQMINNQIKPEIGYHLRKDMQHKGFAKEASLAVRDWAFTNTPFNTVFFI